MLARVKLRGRRSRRGVALRNAVVGVSVGGCVLAAFVPTFVRNLHLSKASEAAEHLERMHQGAAAYFAATRTIEGVDRTACLPDSAGPTPLAPSEDPVEVLFGAPETPGHETWSALGFQPDRGIRFSYAFEPVAVGCGLRSPEGTYLVTFRARGDLDGDGEQSIFERRAAASDAPGTLEPVGILYVADRVE